MNNYSNIKKNSLKNRHRISLNFIGLYRNIDTQISEYEKYFVLNIPWLFHIYKLIEFWLILSN